MKIYLSTLIMLISFFASCQNDSKKKQHLNLKDNMAIQGYDPVAYFEGEAIEGIKEFSVEHNGAIYYFVSEAHKNTFLENPSRYEPQYGGWCAYAMGVNGEKVSINPKTFKIRDGKLYLFYNAYFNNTLKDWNKDEDQLKTEADKNWNQLLKN